MEPFSDPPPPTTTVTFPPPLPPERAISSPITTPGTAFTGTFSTLLPASQTIRFPIGSVAIPPPQALTSAAYPHFSSTAPFPPLASQIAPLTSPFGMPSTAPLSPQPFSGHLNQINTVKLDRSNYILWRYTILPVIRGHELEGHLFGGQTTPPPFLTHSGPGGVTLSSAMTNPAYEEWNSNDQLLMGWLRGSMREQALTEIIGCNTAAEIWKTLERLFNIFNSQSCMLEFKDALTKTSKGSNCTNEVHKESGSKNGPMSHTAIMGLCELDFGIVAADSRSTYNDEVCSNTVDKIINICSSVVMAGAGDGRFFDWVARLVPVEVAGQPIPETMGDLVVIIVRKMNKIIVEKGFDLKETEFNSSYILLGRLNDGFNMYSITISPDRTSLVSNKEGRIVNKGSGKGRMKLYQVQNHLDDWAVKFEGVWHCFKSVEHAIVTAPDKSCGGNIVLAVIDEEGCRKMEFRMISTGKYDPEPYFL